MSYQNRVFLEGFVGQDPKPRPLPSGGNVVNLSLATKEFWRDGKGAEKEATEWHALAFYDGRAEIAGQYRKGDNIHVEGKIVTRRWKDNEGHDKKTTEIVVIRTHRIDRIKVDGRPADDRGEDAGGGNDFPPLDHDGDIPGL
jgi:single-strand DNA-binding protein